MPEFLAYREQILHSPPVLLPRTARLYAKLASGLGQAPAFLAYGELVLYSSPVLLPRTAQAYTKLASKLGQVPKFFVYGVLVLHSPPVLPASLPCLPSFALQTRGLYYRREFY